MKTYLMTILILLAIPATVRAQDTPEVYLKADLTSAYLWRGEKEAGVCVQPTLGLKWRGVNFFAWGNEQLSPPAGRPVEHEIDLVLRYSPVPQLTVGFMDVFVSSRGDGAFSFGSIPHAANGLEALIAYDFSRVNFEWTTTVAGYDGYNHHGHRAYGSYMVVSAPFKFSKLDWNAQIGIVPYYCSRYSDDASGGFHVNMCALKASKTFAFEKINSSLTPYFQLMVNPSARTAYFRAAASFAFNTH